MNINKLKTTRLLLRSFKDTDLATVHTLLNHPESNIYNPGIVPNDEAATKIVLSGWIHDAAMQPRNRFTFYIHDNDNQFIGIISIGIIKTQYKNAEIWYKISPEFWGKGYATEAVKAIIKFGFETLLLHRIEAGCAVGNVASYKVLEKAGMFREAHTRKLLPLKSGWSDNYGYAILEEDFVKTQTSIAND